MHNWSWLISSSDSRWCDKITDAGLQALAPLEALQSLDLTCCSKNTDAGLQALASHVIIEGRCDEGHEGDEGNEGL